MNDADIVKKLKQSPLFQLSIASKELFHSNFLYWLSQNYKPRFFNLLKKLLAGKDYLLNQWGDEYRNEPNFAEGDKIVVKREKDNFDLSIWKKEPSRYKRKSGNNNKGDIKKDNSGNTIYDYIPLLVLENKVKSVIYKEQLNRYEDKLKYVYKTEIENIDLILLSLAEVPKDITNQNKWKIISYGQLKEALECCFLQNPDDSSLTSLMIKDYCNFIGQLHNLAQIWSKEEKLFKDDSIAKNLRMDDIRQKIIFSKSANIIQEKLNGEFSIERGMNKAEMHRIVNSVDSKVESSLPVVFINEGYMRSGLLDIKFHFEKPSTEYFNVIQVQDKCIRYAIEYNDEDKNRNENCSSVVRDLKKAWKQILPDCDSLQISHFGTNFFFYKYEMSDDQTISDITEKLKTTMLNAKEVQWQKKPVKL